MERFQTASRWDVHILLYSIGAERIRVVVVDLMGATFGGRRKEIRENSGAEGRGDFTRI